MVNGALKALAAASVVYTTFAERQQACGPLSTDASDLANKIWHQGGSTSVEESLYYHFDAHGQGVGASDIHQYLRKAEGMAQNLKGAKTRKVEGAVQGVVRHIKNGRFIDIAPDGRIISFGSVND